MTGRLDCQKACSPRGEPRAGWYRRGRDRDTRRHHFTPFPDAVRSPMRRSRAYASARSAMRPRRTSLAAIPPMERSRSRAICSIGVPASNALSSLSSSSSLHARPACDEADDFPPAWCCPAAPRSAMAPRSRARLTVGERRGPLNGRGAPVSGSTPRASNSRTCLASPGDMSDCAGARAPRAGDRLCRSPAACQSGPPKDAGQIARRRSARSSSGAALTGDLRSADTTRDRQRTGRAQPGGRASRAISPLTGPCGESDRHSPHAVRRASPRAARGRRFTRSRTAAAASPGPSPIWRSHTPRARKTGSPACRRRSKRNGGIACQSDCALAWRALLVTRS